MQLKNETIIMLALPRFDDAIESNSYIIATHLAKNNIVYYIDNPFTYKDALSPDKKEQIKKRKSFQNSIHQTAISGLRILRLPTIPSINFLPEGVLYRLLLRYNEKMIVNAIKKLLRKEQITDFIFFNAHNFHYPNVGAALQAKLKIYYCVDPLVRPYDTRHGIISEAILTKNSDVVICSSKQLYEEKKQENANSFFVANAADISHSSRALNAAVMPAPNIAALSKPIVGYFGNIERRMDFSLMEAVAKMNPDTSFVFVGPVEREYVPERFFNNSNIYHFPAVPYAEMPSVVKAFDVAIIPFKKDNLSRTIFPLKLFEYLGAGKAVVATDFNEDLKAFSGDAVYYCKDALSFSNALEKALNEPGSNIEKRVQIAAENTWEQRFVQFDKIIADALKNKKP